MRDFKLSKMNETPGEFGHYSIHACDDNEGMDTLKKIFPDAEANDLNLVFVGTSGVHGSYAKPWDKNVIKEVKKGTPWPITFLYVQTRTIQFYYGNAKCETLEDLKFLTKLSDSTVKIVGETYSSPRMNHAK